jgi:hypothetical protein
MRAGEPSLDHSTRRTARAAGRSQRGHPSLGSPHMGHPGGRFLAQDQENLPWGRDGMERSQATLARTVRTRSEWCGRREFCRQMAWGFLVASGGLKVGKRAAATKVSRLSARLGPCPFRGRWPDQCGCPSRRTAAEERPIHARRDQGRPFRQRPPSWARIRTGRRG